MKKIVVRKKNKSQKQFTIGHITQCPNRNVDIEYNEGVGKNMWVASDSPD